MKDTKLHNFPMDTPLKTTLETELGTLYFFEQVVVMQMNGGITLTYKNGAELLMKALAILGLKPFVIISNRINSYAVDPNDYRHLYNVPTLKGIAIVYHTEEGKKNTQLEQTFFQKPFKAFTSMKDAIFWSKLLLNN